MSAFRTDFNSRRRRIEATGTPGQIGSGLVERRLVVNELFRTVAHPDQRTPFRNQLHCQIDGVRDDVLDVRPPLRACIGG